MKRIVFRMEVNIYDGISYCPYDHIASFLTTEYLITFNIRLGFVVG